jgi:hypothetical protein
MVWRHSGAPAVPLAADLLAQSEAAALPPGRAIAIHIEGRTLLRPAVLVTTAPGDVASSHLAALFTQADYSWQDPLNARSFATWRNRLHSRRDTVSVVDPGGPRQAYRVQTETDSNVLRRASLTLRGPELRPVSGNFQFAGEPSLDMEEAEAPLPAGGKSPQASEKKEPAEVPAGPADALQVLAALNRIGADVGEPIVVSLDAQQGVRVNATGLSEERKQHVAAALRGLPHVQLDLDAGPSEPLSTPRPSAPEHDSAGMPSTLRKELEDRLGGPIALQALTDRVLEDADTAVSVAHALRLLNTLLPADAETKLFDSDRQLLHQLRQGYISRLSDLTAQMRGQLMPLLPSADSSAVSQNDDLYTIIGAIDSQLNRLLAGSPSLPAAEAVLRQLPREFDLLSRRIEESAR